MSNSSSVLEKSLSSSSSSELMGCRGQFFSDLFKQFPDPCWIISEGLFVDCNYAAAQIMGYEQELPDFPIHPADISPLLQPDGQNSKHKAIKMLCLGWQKGSHRFEWMHQNKKGQCLPVEVTLTRVTIQDQSFLYCVWRDMTVLHQTLKELEEDRQQLIKTEQMANLGRWTLDYQQGHLTWSDQVYRIFGFIPQSFEPTYSRFLESIHPDDRSRVDEAYQTSIRDLKSSYEIEHRLVHPQTGLIRYVLERCEHIRDNQGNMIKSFGMILDVTEQKKWLQEKEYLVHSIEASANEIYLYDAETLRFRYVNEMARNKLGYSLDELKDMTPLDIKPQIEKVSFLAALKTLRDRDKKDYVFQTMHKTQKGFLYPVKVHIQYFEPEIELPYFLCIVVDETEQQQIEAKLLSLYHVIDAIVWSVDETMNIEYMGSQIKSLLGYDPNQFIGVHLMDWLKSDLFHSEQCEKNWIYIKKRLEKGIPVKNIEYCVRSLQGEWKWVSLSISMINDVNHQFQNMVGVMTDITQIKRAEMELKFLNSELDKRVQAALCEIREKDALLQQQSRLVEMGEMIGNIAHQWRQPLNSLSLVLMDLEDNYLSGVMTEASFMESIDYCNQLLAKMSSTIDDFRHFFSTDKVLIETVLHHTIEETLSMLYPSLIRDGIQIIVHKPEQAIRIQTYAGELSQVFSCLINNAKDQILHQGIKSGVITIEINELPEVVVVKVMDNGGGVTEEIKDKIFDPYFSSKSDGMGIGLYISKIAIEQSLQGQLSCENTREGACFTVRLPKEIIK